MESPMPEQQAASETATGITTENKNRINRMTYLFSSLAMAVPVIIGVVIDTVLGYQNPAEFNFEANGLAPFTLITVLAAFVYTVIIGVKRLHDIEASGWWILLLFVPFVSIGLTVALLVYPGTKGSNAYGAEPTRRYVYLFR